MIQQAGDDEARCSKSDHDDSRGHRVALQGSPFAVSVKVGLPSATGSSVRGIDATPELGVTPTSAGERLTVRPQVRDRFGNDAAAPEGALTAMLHGPSGS